MTVIAVKSSAKVNLFLNITGIRGKYHLLESFVIFVDLYDDIIINQNDTSFSVSFDTSSIENITIDPIDNTVYKAAAALTKKCGVGLRGNISVYKRIPAGSGMGCGSSNAAAVLRALGKQYKVPYKDLHSIATKIGSDVAVCLAGTPSFVSGVGEIIDPVHFDEELHLVLAYCPGISLLSSSVYSKLDDIGYIAHTSVQEEFLSRGNKIEIALKYGNDLYRPSAVLAPDVQRTVDTLCSMDKCMLARMTGSGSACFGIFPEKHSALMAVDKMQKLGFWACYAKPHNEQAYEMLP